MATTTDSKLDYLFTHIFLPQQLPHADDHGNGSGDKALVDLLAQVASSFRGMNDARFYPQWSTVVRMLRTYATLHQNDNTFSNDALKDAVRGTRDGDIIVLHVAAQNSSLMLRKNTTDYLVESFEVSPPAADVLDSLTALQWDFPSRAVAVPAITFEDEDFEASFLEYLEKASVESIQRYAATTRKANSNAYESRDTVSPAIVGQLLMTILEANGENLTPPVTRKKVRDDVCWGDGALNPWRRSPTWLVLRVALQRNLSVILGGDMGNLHYKFFMCFLLSSLLHDLCVDVSYPAERLAFARTKLARRVAKLELLRNKVPSPIAQAIDTMFLIYGKGFSKTLHEANNILENRGVLARSNSIKRIAPLPTRADPESLVLSLFHSRDILTQILRGVSTKRSQIQVRLSERLREKIQGSAFMERQMLDTETVIDYLTLADFETEVQNGAANENLDRLCAALAYNLNRYQNVALSAYQSDPENLSLMVITIMGLWRALDTAAIKLFPMLAMYNPGFPSNLLHALQVSQLEDMRRVQGLENYLEYREGMVDATRTSVFGVISATSFAVQYFDQCQEMKDLMTTMQEADKAKRAIKEQEWRVQGAEHSRKLEAAAKASCVYVINERGIKEHDFDHCTKCFLKRKAKRMEIHVHEALLPANVAQAKAVVFELLLPHSFAAWRDATWQVLQLAQSRTSAGHKSETKPEMLLRAYAGFRRYAAPTKSYLTLASTTKLFEKTHYPPVKFPTPFSKVCVPHGGRYDLFDPNGEKWTSNYQRIPSFADLCDPGLPAKSSYDAVRHCVHPTFGTFGISGNATVAGQTRCPINITVPEFVTFQDLSLGTSIPWISILRELASANLNFGTSEVCTLITQLALQLGPPKDRSALRGSHWVFDDPVFCTALLDQIKRRLRDIAANWREGQTVECMIVLVQRIWSLASTEESREEARDALMWIRAMTHKWTRLLRHEICNATDVETAQKRSRDALIAAILTRKTFVIEASKPDRILCPTALACFLECAFTLKENLPHSQAGYIARMDPPLKRLFIADLKLVHRLELALRRSIQTYPHGVDEAVNHVWTYAEGTPVRLYTAWTPVSASHNGWFTAQASNQGGLFEQFVHVDIYEGTLLIDGQPLGRLPEEYTKEEFFQQLFGTRIFLTYPSAMPSMSFRLATLWQGHEIHFGYRKGVAFIRTRNRGKTTEWIPRTIFMEDARSKVPDLPLPLIHNSVHWLDLGSQTLEVRPFATMWRSKDSDWTINLKTSQAWRRGSRLVDLRSLTFNHVASLIEPFENRSNMVVFQPATKNISVRLPRLELDFHVNQHGLLYSQQLTAIVDQNQDAGTFYGLRSSLVLRDAVVPEDRSILVALGPAEIIRNRNGGHVTVNTFHQGYYARFQINTELGRLECPSEPRLIYFKAYMHAITSFVMPDPLTGRTGTEEAIDCLQAGNAQPWAPLDTKSHSILCSIATLTPQRMYYPENLKAMQKVSWREDLSPAAQHDSFRLLVSRILDQSRRLCVFHLGSEDLPPLDHKSNEYLLTRASARSQIHGIVQKNQDLSLIQNPIYVARDVLRSDNTKNAFEIAMSIKNWSRRTAVSKDLAASLRDCRYIQGFEQIFDLPLLSDWIGVDIAASWGSLFKLCRTSSERSHKFKLMFLFSTMVFGIDDHVTLLKTLVASLFIEEIKELELPQGSIFIDFKPGLIPTIDSLAELIGPFKVPYPGDERDQAPAAKMKLRRRQNLEMAEKVHDAESERSCRSMANHLISQWPCRVPHVDGLGDLPLLDSATAHGAIQPQWERLFDNFELMEHLKCVQPILNSCRYIQPQPLKVDVEVKPEVLPRLCLPKVQPSIWELLCNPVETIGITSRRLCSEECQADVDSVQLGIPPVEPSSETDDEIQSLIYMPPTSRPSLNSTNELPALIQDLQTIVTPFARDEDAIRRDYGQDLECSIAALISSSAENTNDTLRAKYELDQTRLAQMISSAQEAANDRFKLIRRTLLQKHAWLDSGGLLPPITHVTLLQSLPWFEDNNCSHATLDAIIDLAHSLTKVQHLKRIQSACLRSDTIQLASEIRPRRNVMWQAKDHIAWLLLQLDFNFLIRPDQYDVAEAMIRPSSATNSVLQMNMGQGKSTIIIPMVVAQLADGDNLARVVVPRPLLLEMSQLLQGRLGGLIGRTVIHVPFSRRSSTAGVNLTLYQDLHRDTLRARGVILALPEHLLSFKLSGLQQLSNGHLQDASTMMELQDWFDLKCRDILDECDHMLAVKTQLIYPSGSQSMVDGHPGRWTVVQDLLKLVKAHLNQLRRDFPKSIEVTERLPGTFPTIYLLNQDVKDALVGRLTRGILSGEAGILTMPAASSAEFSLIESLLRHATISEPVAVPTLKGDSDSHLRVLLLRGLLVYGILLLGLGKRWNVQYGIDPYRHPIAVPFRSKGIPCDQSEYGHPDVSIILTCLSFYYAGLTLPQFQQTLGHLLKSDEPAREFEAWRHHIKSFPESLSSWKSINIHDEAQCTQLWTLLRNQMTVINSFLNNFVFPRHAKTFERKLVSSGWDIAMQSGLPGEEPLAFSEENVYPRVNGMKSHSRNSTSLTVGFSGTSDNKTLLPLNIVQNDLPGLSHTNAEVLTYLLQPRNRRYVLAADGDGRRLSEKALLENLYRLGIRMLLDAGAQILESDNRTLAKTWLLVDTKAEAAVYFGEDDRATVIYRKGKDQPLAASPYLNNLGSCLVYLDEVSLSSSLDPWRFDCVCCP